MFRPRCACLLSPQNLVSTSGIKKEREEKERKKERKEERTVIVVIVAVWATEAFDVGKGDVAVNPATLCTCHSRIKTRRLGCYVLNQYTRKKTYFI